MSILVNADTRVIVQGITGPDTLHRQCRLIVAELAKEGESR